MEGLIKKLSNVFPVTVFDAIFAGDGTKTTLKDYLEVNTRNLDVNVKSVNHRGYCTVAPENTLSAYKLSAKMGYTYVETDISFTSDGVPVLLHDDTIDRTSNGSGNIASMTLEQVKTYDFGTWKSEDYYGEKIPTLEEFMALCRNLGLIPYLEIKAYAEIPNEYLDTCMTIVENYGMSDKVTWISFDAAPLTYIAGKNNASRIGYLSWWRNDEENPISALTEFKELGYNVFLDSNHSYLTSDKLDMVRALNIPVEVWTVDSANTIVNLNPYISGVTSNNLIAGKVLYENSIQN